MKRRFLPALLTAAALALTGCSASSGDAAGAAASTGPWSFTDDLGKTITLDQRPTRIAGLNDVLASLMRYGITPVASFGYSSIKDDTRFTGLDVSGVTEVGATYGEIDVEKLTGAAPDLIVAHVYPTDSKGTIDKTQPDYGFKDLTQQTQIEKIAPVVTIYMGGDGAKVIQRTTELATALGAPADRVAAAEKTYTAAKTDLQAAAAEAKTAGVQTTVLYADADGISVAKVADDPALRLYRDLGVDFFTPAPEGFYWGNYSWENAGKIDGDLILYITSGYRKDELLKQPTFAALPAAKAGQLQPYDSAGLDYVSQADELTKVAGYLRGAAPAA
ncbi:ABC transporter substrate-binding protein [Actinoplanes sp. NPDC051851]|uniref:ABC transporter substrate-binding protein n=1 Tax=Actinoplanes sp. NPDC051851 TaxID=3154753 RepID=UPI003424C6DF